MSLKDRLNINTDFQPVQKKLNELPEEISSYDGIFESIIEENDNILVFSRIDVPTYSALNFLCSKIKNEKRLVGIGSNLLLNPNEIIKFEPDTKNLSKELVKTALSLNPFKIIVQDFEGAEAVDIFKMINSDLKNIITAVNASSPEKALCQAELNLYVSGITVPEPLMKKMIADFIDKIIFVETLNKRLFISKMYNVIGLKNNEYEIAEILKNKVKKEPKSIESQKLLNKKNDVQEVQEKSLITVKKKNILAEKLRKKKINK